MSLNFAHLIPISLTSSTFIFQTSELTCHLSICSWHCDDCDYGFQTEGELRRHYFDSNQHPSCLKCQRGFVDHAAKKQHLRDSSNHGYCYVCDRGFYDDAALQTHYLKDNKHPNCCGRGFEDADELNAHTKSAHPKPARQAPPSYQAASVQRQTNQTNIEPSSGSVQTPTSNLPTPAVPSQQSPVTVQMSSQELQDAYQKGFEQVIRFITQLQAQSLFPTLAQAPPSQAQIQSQYVPPPAQVVNLPPPIQQLGQAQPVLAEAQVVNAAPQIQPQVQLRPIFAQSQVENSKLQNEAQAQSVHPKAQDKSHELQNGVQPAVEDKSYECLACKAISKDWDTLAEHFTQNSVHKKRHADTRIEQYWNAEEEKRVVTLPEYESSATNKQSSHPTTKVSSVFQPFSFKSNAQSSNTKAEPVSQDAGSSSNGNGSGSGYSKCGINYVKLDESRDHQCGGSKSCENVQEGPSTRSALQTSQWKTEVSSSSSAAQLSVNPFEFIKPTLSSGRQSSARHPGVFNSRIIPNINSISSGSLGQKATNGSGSSAQTKGSYANDLVVIVTENGSVSRIQPPPKPLAQNNAAVPKESYPSKPHEVPVPLAAKDMNPPGHLKLNSPLTNAENLKAHLARKAKEKAEEKEAKSMKQGIENVKVSNLKFTVKL